MIKSVYGITIYASSSVHSRYLKRSYGWRHHRNLAISAEFFHQIPENGGLPMWATLSVALISGGPKRGPKLLSFNPERSDLPGPLKIVFFNKSCPKIIPCHEDAFVMTSGAPALRVLSSILKEQGHLHDVIGFFLSKINPVRVWKFFVKTSKNILVILRDLVKHFLFS